MTNAQLPHREAEYPTQAERLVQTTPATVDQPTPHGTGAPVFDLLLADIEARRAKGIATYGEPLTTFNGRDAAVDLYQELLDAAVYARQWIEERRALLALLHEAMALDELAFDWPTGTHRCRHCRVALVDAAVVHRADCWVVRAQHLLKRMEAPDA